MSATSDLAVLSSVVTQVEELSRRVTELAEQYGETPDSAVAAELFASEGGPDIELVPGPDGWFRGHGLIGPYRFERDAEGRATTLVGRDLGLTRYERVEAST